jgi:two-component sensor histidine kinase
MMVLYDRLYRSGIYDEVPMAVFLPSLIEEILASFPNSGSVRVEHSLGDFALSSVQLLPLGIIVNELLTNIMKYAFAGRAGGLVRVSAALRDGRVIVILEDDGLGIPPGLDFKASPGFGLALVSLLTEQLKGSIRVERGSGTRIVLDFEK